MKTLAYDFTAPGDKERTQYVLDVISSRTPVSQATVLDLACRTGAFSRKLAAAGATVVGVEGKEVNYRQIPLISGADFFQADVRDLADLQLPVDQFDVVLCLGLMYHLEACDVCELLGNMRYRTREGGFVIVDTHVGARSHRITIDGVVYNGELYDEGEPGPWSSLGNDESFWFSRESLHHLCQARGWTVEELPGPSWDGLDPGRHWMVLS
jgi:SAM-dependent methyltransferase